MPDFGHLLRANARKRARRHQIWEVFLGDRRAPNIFDFYVESPEWFDGTLQRAAALLELFRPADSDPESLLRKIGDSWKEHNGPGWWMRRAVLCTSDAIGHI